MKTLTIQEMRESTAKLGLKVTPFDNDGITNYQVEYWKKRSGPMTEDGLHWFLRGFLNAKGEL